MIAEIILHFWAKKEPGKGQFERICFLRSWENPAFGSIWVLIVENRLTSSEVGSHGSWASYTTNVLEPTDLYKWSRLKSKLKW